MNLCNGANPTFFYQGFAVSFACKLTGGTAQSLKVFARMDGDNIAHEFIVTPLGDGKYTAILDTTRKNTDGRFVMSIGRYKLQALVDGVTPSDIELRGFELRAPIW